MAIKSANIRTGNTALPIYQPTAAELLIAGMANRRTWIEGDAGYFSKDQTKWYDKGTGAAAGNLITGSLGIAGGAINGKKAALFNKTQSVQLSASGFPVAGDYTLLFAGLLTDLATGQALFTGDAASTYHAIFVQTTGKIAIYHGGVNHLLTTATLSANTPYVLTFGYVESTKTMTIKNNGSLMQSGSMSVGNTDPTLRFGNLSGGSNLQFGGQVPLLSWFDRDISQLLSGQTTSDLDTITTYARTMLGV